MYKIRIDNFDLEQVAKSGQCFRWLKNGENTYNIAAFGREVDITQNGNEFTLSCDEDEWNNIWKDYLDIICVYIQIVLPYIDIEGLSGYRHRLWKDSKADRRRG